MLVSIGFINHLLILWVNKMYLVKFLIDSLSFATNLLYDSSVVLIVLRGVLLLLWGKADVVKAHIVLLWQLLHLNDVCGLLEHVWTLLLCKSHRR